MVFRRIKDLREDHDWTQKEVADQIYIARSSYTSYENGANTFPVTVLSQLADLYDTSIDYLVGRTNNPQPYEPTK